MNQESIVVQLVRQLRPKQWSKNFLLFAALLFSYQLSNMTALGEAALGFVLFSLTASAVYIWNDYKDMDADKNHPVKKYRPMPSGKLSPNIALTAGILLLVFSLTTAGFVSLPFMMILIVYLLTNVLYSLYLKHIVLIDIFVIALGFVLRAVGGALIINVPSTAWFLLCTLLLSLFLAIGKRRHELSIQLAGNSHRRVLDEYSMSFLDQLTSIVTSATIVSYAVFTFTSDSTELLMFTIPLVIYGMFRYLYLIHIRKEGGAPEKVLFSDKHILTTVVLYVASVWFILTFLN